MPPLAVDEFQGALEELAAKSGEAAARLVGRLSVLSAVEARAFVTDAYPELLTPFAAASSDLTAQWYAEQPTLPRPAGAALYVPETVGLPPREQMSVSARWALTTSTPATSLAGSASRQVMNSSRDTVVANAVVEGARYVRQAQINACGFCKMLATRSSKEFGAGRGTRRGRQRRYSYSSEGVFRDPDTGQLYLGVIGRRGSVRGTRPLGSKYHDNCKCIAVPVRDGRYEPPDYVERWTQEYDDIFDKSGGDLNTISRVLDADRVRPNRVARSVQSVLREFVSPTARVVDLDATQPGERGAASVDDPQAVARRLLPGLRNSLANLKAKGLADDAPQVVWHREQIARLEAALPTAG